VLDEYSDCRSWRLRERIGMVRPDDGVDLSPRFVAAAAVEGAKEGEEVFIQSGHGIDAYGVRGKAWRKAAIGPRYAALLMHRESVVQPEMSFGREALRCAGIASVELQYAALLGIAEKVVILLLITSHCSGLI